MRFLVLPVFPPALREGFLLGILREPRNEIGVAGGDALLLEGFGHFGDELKQSKAGIDETVALARLLGQGGNVIPGKVEEPLESLDYASYCTSLLAECT